MVHACITTFSTFLNTALMSKIEHVKIPVYMTIYLYRQLCTSLVDLMETLIYMHELIPI
jgi:hypothetical protein